jgi:hypothetical protein
MLAAALAATAVTWSGCATPTFRPASLMGTPLTRSNNQLDLPRFSFLAPADQGWRVRRPAFTAAAASTYGARHPADGHEVVDVTLQLGPPASALLVMRFMQVDIVNARIRSWSARQVADAYRNQEKEPGREGQPLVNLVMGEETIGGSTFYTMKYGIVASTYAQTSEIYLHFPRAEGNEYFVVAHYSETTPPGGARPRSYRREFLQTLTTLRAKP